MFVTGLSAVQVHRTCVSRRECVLRYVSRAIVTLRLSFSYVCSSGVFTRLVDLSILSTEGSSVMGVVFHGLEGGVVCRWSYLSWS